MKTKKFFLLLAAVLLGSASMFAQSANNNPLKGDVNGDGTVDVADMVNIIKIMKEGGGSVGEKMGYWYVGTNNGNAVTADNFIDVATRIPESEIPETGSVTANGQYIYFVMPETRRLSSLTSSNGSTIEYECADALGYHIYKTSNIVNGTVYYGVEQIKYYWYVGTDPITSSSTPGSGTITYNETEIGWHPINGTPIEIQVGPTARLSANANWYIAIPSKFGITKASSGCVDMSVKYNQITLSDGVPYNVFIVTTTKKVDYLMIK